MNIIIPQKYTNKEPRTCFSPCKVTFPLYGNIDDGPLPTRAGLPLLCLYSASLTVYLCVDRGGCSCGWIFVWTEPIAAAFMQEGSNFFLRVKELWRNRAERGVDRAASGPQQKETERGKFKKPWKRLSPTSSSPVSLASMPALPLCPLLTRQPLLNPLASPFP